LLWDAVGSEFASRHELYEINYAGSYEASQIEPLNAAKGMGRAAEYVAMVDACMAEYDINGWTAPDLIAAGDVSVRKKAANG
jgi:4-hydroxyphenylacetate 3-monooxygenase